MKVLVLAKGNDLKNLNVGFESLYRLLPGTDFSIFSSVAVPINDRAKLIIVDSEESIMEAMVDIEFEQVVLVGYGRQDLIRLPVLTQLLSRGIDSIRLVLNNVLVRYSPFFNVRTRTLVVFPGSILPLNMGSHQRVFNMIAALAYYGSAPVDVLITGGKNLSVAARLLQSVVANVYTYKNNKRKMPRVLRFRRGAERFFRKFFGMSENVPELFVDRLSNKATYSLQKTLARLVEEKAYKNVILSYAWLDKARDLVDMKTASEIRWFCDTHDVQYVRNQSSNRSERRFLSFQRLDKYFECRVLNGYDYVMAISQSDFNEISKGLGNKAILVTSSFDYAFRAVKKRPESKPLDFGFIGGKMDANVRSLLYILQEWWPRIQLFSPSSTLFVAGSVGNDSRIQDYLLFDDSVVSLGFVGDLSEFYKKIDISLNPAIIQGGLNFKSVEAVAFGKLLITNSLGAECLGEAGIETVVNSADELIEFLHALECDPERLHNMRVSRQTCVSNVFGQASAYSELRDLLND